MELDITDFLLKAGMMDYSASAVEIGQDAGEVTWAHACADSPDWMFLNTEEKRDAARKFFVASGGWTEGEIAAFTDLELNALLLQFIAGHMREGGLDVLSEDSTPEEMRAAFAKYEANEDLAHLVGISDDGQIYYCVGG